jgi:hypothetical protein
MTTIISRLYADPPAARAVGRKLSREGFRDADMDVISAREGEEASALERRLARAMLHPDAIPGYAERIAGGGAAVVVRADYTPLGARRIAREIFAASAPVQTNAGPEEHEVKTPPRKPGLPTVLTDHPLFFRTDRDPGTGRELGLISSFLGLPTLSGRGHRDSVSRPGGPVTEGYMAMVSRKPRAKSVIEGGGTVFSNALGWKLVIERD